jgi:hypothetical protein
VSDSGSRNESGRRIKVVRLIEEYELDDVGDRMEDRWTDDGDERMSLRRLADYFNRAVLREAMSDAGMQPLDGEVENTYRLLDAGDVGEAERTRTRRRLEREGVDVEEVRNDFVTYQAIRTYLKEHRGATYDEEGPERTEVASETIQELRGRVVSVLDERIEGLRRNDDVELGEFRTLVDINVLCEDCGTQQSAETLIEGGGCDCSEETVGD